MTDLIEKAIDGWQDEKKREATGKVEGHSVRVEKKEYETGQRGPTAWKVAVYVGGGDGPLPTEKNGELSANEAQSQFDDLVNNYNLIEV